VHPIRPYQSRRDFLRTALGSTVAVAALGTAATPATAGVGAGAAGAPTGSGGELPDDALRAGLRAVTDAGMPGVFAEVRDGRAIWRGASGVADLATGRPIRPEFPHRVGSVNKTLVATALLQLVAERRLSLDAPVRRYLPHPVPAGMTVRMLLNQTGGLNDYDHVLFATAEDIEKYQHTTIKPVELVRIGLAEPPVGAPGERHYYANTNYILAGLLLERITRRPAAVELTRRILRPLGMRRSYFPGTAPRIEGAHSAGYLPWIDGTLRDFSVYNMSWVWAAGELVSTTADLNRFFRALLGGRLLRPAELAEMRRTVPADPANPDGVRYGLGLVSVPLPGVSAWGHDGVVFGYETMSLHSADGRRQVTVALNASHYSAPGQPNPVGAALFDFLVTALGGAAPARTAPADRALGSRTGHGRFTPAPGAAALAP
jgi:D-alanyl-D-alanine carboxypeptidase